MKTYDPKEAREYKKMANQETENKWKGKQMHGQYVRDLTGVDWEKTWWWMQKGDLKGCKEALICSTQEQALRNNHIKCHTVKNTESPMCRMCGEKGESVNHLTLVSAASWHNISIRSTTIMLHCMCIGNCVERQNLSGPISGTNTSQSKW